MARYKTLDDYCLNASPKAFKSIRAMISHDFVNGLIARANFDVLLDDLQAEINAARGLFRASESASR
jgi:hypothetical protein